MERSFEAAIWSKGTVYLTIQRIARCFCLTELILRYGFHRIPARLQWKADYLSTEWWHFENREGLVANATQFGDELRKLYSPEAGASSGLPVDTVWNGTRFHKAS